MPHVWKSSLVLIALVTVSACTEDLPMGPDESTPRPDSAKTEPRPATRPSLEVTGNTTVDDTVLLNLTVRPGGRLIVRGTRVVVDGTLTVEAGGSIEGVRDRLDLVARGNMNLAGPVRSAGHLALVDDPARIPSASRLETPRDTFGITFFELAAVPDSGRSWSISAAPEIGVVRGESTASSSGSSVTRSPQRGRTMYLYMTGNLSVGAPAGAAAPLNLAFPDGADGRDVQGCGATGSDGETGGNVDWTIEGALVVQQATFTGGNGGRGGDAIAAAPCANGSHNRGGTGGVPGSFSIAVGSFGLVRGMIVANGWGINGWDWGRGGDASLTGMAGQGVGANGASVQATGGNATTVRRYLYVSQRIHVLPGGLVLSLLNGGRGGHAVATGGLGAPGQCDANGIGSKSGDGGDAKATGRNANDIQVVYSIHSLASIGRLFRADNGGDADATGGNGGVGVVCPIKGGDGGNGGEGDATRGLKGSSLFPGQTNRNGIASAAGADGGNGGNAGGHGGDGGRGGDSRKNGALANGGGRGGNGGNAVGGGNGGNGGCGAGNGGAGGAGLFPGAPGTTCPAVN